jgi:hypothetical protein
VSENIVVRLFSVRNEKVAAGAVFREQLVSGSNERPSFHIRFELPINESRDSSVGTALGYGLDDRGSRARFPAMIGNFSLHHRF